MEELRQFIVNDLQQRLTRHSQLMSFIDKVIGVLLAEAVSSLAFEILTQAIFGSDSSLGIGDGALLARLIYAILITLYAPCMAWTLSKFAPKGPSFRAIILQNHAKVCPVLLAWGWKDFAAQLDTWADSKLWVEIVLSSSLTVIVVITQALPCFNKFKAGVAAGGATDTLLARFMIIPSCLGLTLGYCWNLVATYFVSKVQSLHSTYYFAFLMQAVYSLIACTTVTVLTALLSNKAAKGERNGGQFQTEKPGQTLTSEAAVAAHSVEDWSGLNHLNFANVIIGIMSFIYGWALLNTTDDFGFGVMFQCASSSSCSYQNNFVYASVVTVVFVICSFTLQFWKEIEVESAILSKAISLQLNAMILTVGWAWMNFYSTFMSAGTGDADTGTGVGLYVSSTIAIFVFHSMTSFVLQRTNQGLVRNLEKTLNVLQSGGKQPANEPCSISKEEVQLMITRELAGLKSSAKKEELDI